MDKKIIILNDKIDLLYKELIKTEQSKNGKQVKALLKKHRDCVQLRYKLTQKG